MADDPRARAIEHAWRYFELHANQRMSVFNFFIVFAGLLSAGLAATLQGPPRFAGLGIALSVLLIFLAFVFWQLDRRASFLVKHAEGALSKSEECLPSEVQLFRLEPTAKKARWQWTYGRSFRFIFLLMALVGVGGAALSGLRFTGALEWKDEATFDKQKAPSSQKRETEEPKRIEKKSIKTAPPAE